MKAISITKKRFENLEKYNVPKNVSNTEGEIYKIFYKNSLKVLKKLYIDSGYNFANKLYTLEMIDTFRDLFPKELYVPDFLVTLDAKTIGFTSPHFEGVNLSSILQDKAISLKEKLFYLKSIGNVLEHLKIIRETTSLKDIYINDLQVDNIMINKRTKEIGFIDLDSISIMANLPFPAKYMTKKSIAFKMSEKYIQYDNLSLIVASKNTDLYCYIILILNYLYGADIYKMEIDEYINYLNYLEFVGIDKKLLDCFASIVDFDDNMDPTNYIDSLNETQVCRANKFIYDKVR